VVSQKKHRLQIFIVQAVDVFRHVLYQWHFTCVKDCRAFGANSPVFFDESLTKKTVVCRQKIAVTEKISGRHFESALND